VSTPIAFLAPPGQSVGFEHAPHLREETIVCQQLVLLGPRTQGSIEVLALQAIHQVIVSEAHSRKSLLVVDAAMTLHDDDAQQLGDTGGKPHEGCIIDDTAPKCLPLWFVVFMQFAFYLLFEYGMQRGAM
jgi:hypothetical protein